MDVKKIPPATPDVLADRRAAINAGLASNHTLHSVRPHEPAENWLTTEEPEPVRPPKRKRDALELYSAFKSQDQIVTKHLNRIMVMPGPETRLESVKIMAIKVAHMLELLKEMADQCRQ